MNASGSITSITSITDGPPSAAFVIGVIDGYRSLNVSHRPALLAFHYPVIELSSLISLKTWIEDGQMSRNAVRKGIESASITKPLTLFVGEGGSKVPKVPKPGPAPFSCRDFFSGEIDFLTLGRSFALACERVALGMGLAGIRTQTKSKGCDAAKTGRATPRADVIDACQISSIFLPPAASGVRIGEASTLSRKGMGMSTTNPSRITKRQAKSYKAMADFLEQMSDDGFSDSEIQELLFGTALAFMMKNGPAFVAVALTRAAQRIVETNGANTCPHPLDQTIGNA